MLSSDASADFSPQNLRRAQERVKKIRKRWEEKHFGAAYEITEFLVWKRSNYLFHR